MQLDEGKIVEGKVTGITNFGAFIDLGDGKTGMVHISEVSNSYVKEISDHLNEGDSVQVKILKIGDNGKISLSIKQTQPNEQVSARPHKSPERPQRSFNSSDNSVDLSRDCQPQSFEDMLSKFKQSSEEKMSDIKRNIDSKRGNSYSRRIGK